MNALVLRSAIVAALGGLLFGFDTAVISGTTQDLERVYQISGFTLGFTVATARPSAASELEFLDVFAIHVAGKAAAEACPQSRGPR